MIRMLLFWCMGLALHVVATNAHHSIAAIYDNSRRATVHGVVAQLHFVNPHPFVLVDATRDGATERWKMEMDNLRELAAVGFAPDTLRPGDRIVVTGSLARQAPHSLYVNRLDRPADGFRYEQIGGSPRIGRIPKS
jgi:uncharacterized protein DUF6152